VRSRGIALGTIAGSLLMIASHALWGVTLTSGIDEFKKAADRGFGTGPLRDARQKKERVLHA